MPALDYSRDLIPGSAYPAYPAYPTVSQPPVLWLVVATDKQGRSERIVFPGETDALRYIVDAVKKGRAVTFTGPSRVGIAKTGTVIGP